MHEITPKVTPYLMSNSPFDSKAWYKASWKDILAVSQKSLEAYPRHPFNLFTVITGVSFSCSGKSKVDYYNKFAIV